MVLDDTICLRPDARPLLLPRRPLPFFFASSSLGSGFESLIHIKQNKIKRFQAGIGSAEKKCDRFRGGVDHHRNGVLLGEGARRAEQRRGQELAEHGVRRSRVFGNPRENPSTGQRRPSGSQRAHEARGVPRRQTPRPRSGPGSGTEGWGQCFFEGGWYTGVLWGGKGRHGPGDGSRARA